MRNFFKENEPSLPNLSLQQFRGKDNHNCSLPVKTMKINEWKSRSAIILITIAHENHVLRVVFILVATSEPWLWLINPDWMPKLDRFSFFESWERSRPRETLVNALWISRNERQLNRLGRSVVARVPQMGKSCTAAAHFYRGAYTHSDDEFPRKL